MLGSALGSLSASASCLGKRAIMSVQARPMAKKVHQATEKMRRTWLGRFIVFASLIMRERATGRPAVAKVRNTPYML